MIIIIAEEGKKIHLGRVGENEARAVRFDIGKIQAEFPGATFSVLNMRPEDPDAYPVNGQYIRIEGNYLYWTLQSGDLTQDALGECELKATVDGVIVKSIIWTTEICPALDGNGTPPEPWESWQQQVEDDADRAEAAAEDSEAWANGERGGEPVEDDDPAYHKNAKYWAEQAEETLYTKADKSNTVLSTTLSRGRRSGTTAGNGSFAFGDSVTASGNYSHAEGTSTTASGYYSHAEGMGTIAKNKSQHVFGEFNVEDPYSMAPSSRGRFVEIVGRGTATGARHNARTLDWNGNERLAGDLYVGANSDGTGGTKVAKVTDIPEPVDISGKADKVAGAVADNFAGLDAEGNLKDSGYKASDFLTAHQDISGKADKVTGATNGNLAGLDGNGNLTDSGKKAADFVPVTSFRADEMPMSETDPTTVAQTTTELKSAIDEKASLIRDTVQNVAIASVPDGASNLPLTVLRFAVEPIQSGSGDPSPSNVRPITGRTGAVVTRTGGNLYNPSLMEKGYVNATAQRPRVLFSKAGTYYINALKTGESSGTVYYIIKNADGTYGTGYAVVNGTTVNKRTVTITDGQELIVYGGASSSATVADVQVIFADWGVIVSPQDMTTYEAYSAATYPITWQTEAGTVFGARLDWVNGVLVVDHVIEDLGNLTGNWSTDNLPMSSNNGLKDVIVRTARASDTADLKCSAYKNMSRSALGGSGVTSGICVNTGGLIIIKDPAIAEMTKEQIKAYVTGVKIVYELVTPITVTLTGLDEIKTAQTAGENNFWADSGDIVELTYPCDTKLYIEKLTKPSEDDFTANANIASGKFFMLGNRLFLSTQAIAQGASIVPGTNCTAFSLADALNAINQ